jgi:hypothetical protein
VLVLDLSLQRSNTAVCATGHSFSKHEAASQVDYRFGTKNHPLSSLYYKEALARDVSWCLVQMSKKNLPREQAFAADAATFGDYHRRGSM